MTGKPGYNRPAFFLAGALLTARGYLVLNPANWPAGLSRLEYMRLDLPMLLSSDGVAVLDGWEEPGGAVVEAALAEYCGLPVRTVAEWLADGGQRHEPEPEPNGE